jgi:hypothetical protein
VILSLPNWVRGFLQVKKDRTVPRRGSKPAIGACIVRGDLRMTIQAGMGDDLWQWLLDQGWRELIYRPDRRHYREVPSVWVTRLIDALPEARATLLQAAEEKASKRPTMGDPKGVPSYVVRE